VFGNLFPQYNNVFLRTIFDGHLSVCIFFVLSGDALSTAFLSSGKYSILAKMIFKRYFRLAGPILLSSILVYFLMSFGLIFSHNAAEITHGQQWLGSFLNFQPSIINTLKFGLRFAFTDELSTHSYDPFLWPMGIELAGSIGIFLYLAIHKNIKYPLTTLVIFGLLLIASRSYYGLFCIGILFAHLRNDGFFEDSFKSTNGKKFVVFCTFLWILTAILVALFDEKPFQIDALLAGCFVFLVYFQLNLIKFFSNDSVGFLSPSTLHIFP